jgi:hypothetical protein
VERFTRKSTSYTAACGPCGQSNASVTWTENFGAGGGAAVAGALVAGRTVGTMRRVGVCVGSKVGVASGVGVSSGVGLARGVKVGRAVRVGVAVPVSRKAVKVPVSQASRVTTMMRIALKSKTRFRSNWQLLSEHHAPLYSGRKFLANGVNEWGTNKRIGGAQENLSFRGARNLSPHNTRFLVAKKLLEVTG